MNTQHPEDEAPVPVLGTAKELRAAIALDESVRMDTPPGTFAYLAIGLMQEKLLERLRVLEPNPNLSLTDILGDDRVEDVGLSPEVIAQMAQDDKELTITTRAQIAARVVA